VADVCISLKSVRNDLVVPSAV